MSWQPTTAPTSTPAPKNQDQSEPASLEATNQNQCAADSQPLVDNSADEDLGQISSHNTQKDYLDEKQIEPLKDLLKNWVNQVQESIKSENPNNIKDTHDDEQCNDDNIEAAKIWAKKQKQSCLEKQYAWAFLVEWSGYFAWFFHRVIIYSPPGGYDRE